MSQTVVTQPAEVAVPSFRVIDPTTEHMMDLDDTEIHRAIGPD